MKRKDHRDFLTAVTKVLKITAKAEAVRDAFALRATP